MILSKVKKLFLLILLVMVSLVLSAVKLISGGGKTSQAQAQCWSPPASSTAAGCYTYGDPSVSASSATTAAGCAASAAAAAATASGCVACSY